VERGKGVHRFLSPLVGSDPMLVFLHAHEAVHGVDERLFAKERVGGEQDGVVIVRLKQNGFQAHSSSAIRIHDLHLEIRSS